MTWKPTEGMLRAEPIVEGLETDAASCGLAGVALRDPLFRARMVDVIGKALDQALADGAEVDARNAMGVDAPDAGANGHDPHATNQVGTYPIGFGAQEVSSPMMPTESQPAAREPKKRRGRPKGSGRKGKPAPAAVPDMAS